MNRANALASLCLLLAAASLVHAAAPVVYVDQAGVCNGLAPCLRTVQAGLAQAAAPAAIVNVFPGIYVEHVDLSQTGSAANGPVALTLQAVDASGIPAISGVTLAAADGEAVWNSIDPYPAAVTIRGLTLTSANEDAIDIEGLTGVLTLEDVIAQDAYFDGIDVRTRADVILIRTQALRNRNDGVQIRFEGPADLIVSQSVSEWNRGFGNGDDGFEIDLFDGSVTFTDTRASHNGADGIDLDGAPAARSINAVTLTRVTLENNGLPDADAGEYDGLDIANVEPLTQARIPLGDIKIDLSTARLNQGGGFDIDSATGGTYLFADSNASANGRDGVQLTLDGIAAPSVGLSGFTVTVRDLTVDGNGTGTGNGGFGLRVRDARNCDLQPVMDVVLQRVSASGNETGGLDVRATRTVTGLTLTALGNGYGEAGTGQGDGISIGALPVANEPGQGPCAPTQVGLTSVVTEANAGDGLQVDGAGEINVSSLLARSNGNPGAPLPGQDGVELNQVRPTSAPMTLRLCTVNGSRDDGAHLAPVSGVTVERCAFTDNGADGLDVAAGPGSLAGALLVTEVTATASGDDGIDVDILGNLTVQQARLDRNVSDGLFIKRVLGLVTVTASSFTASGQAGLQLRVMGAGAHRFETNDIVGNAFGVANLNSTGTLSFGGNFWGSPTGPTHPGNPGGVGDSIYDRATGGVGTVSFTGFLAASAVPPPQVREVPLAGPVGLLALGALCARSGQRRFRRRCDSTDVPRAVTRHPPPLKPGRDCHDRCTARLP